MIAVPTLVRTVLGRRPSPSVADEPAPAPTRPHGAQVGRGAGSDRAQAIADWSLARAQIPDGNPNLEMWPPSGAECALADQYNHLCTIPALDTPEMVADLRAAWIALEGTCGSHARAQAVCRLRRRERDAAALASRAFGVQP